MTGNHRRRHVSISNDLWSWWQHCKYRPGIIIIYPLTVRAIPDHLRDVSCIGTIQIDITFTFYLCCHAFENNLLTFEVLVAFDWIVQLLYCCTQMEATISFPSVLQSKLWSCWHLIQLNKQMTISLCHCSTGGKYVTLSFSWSFWQTFFRFTYLGTVVRADEKGSDAPSPLGVMVNAEKFPFAAFKLLVGWQEGHPACKKTGCWFVGGNDLTGALHVS